MKYVFIKAHNADKPMYVTVGFWSRMIEDAPDGWPLPKPSGTPVNPEDIAFIEDALTKWEKSWIKGIAFCRICGKRNGCTEYSLPYDVNGKQYNIVCPGGYFHYLKDHNVPPHIDFFRDVAQGKPIDKYLVEIDPQNTHYLNTGCRVFYVRYLG